MTSLTRIYKKSGGSFALPKVIALHGSPSTVQGLDPCIANDSTRRGRVVGESAHHRERIYSLLGRLQVDIQIRDLENLVQMLVEEMERDIESVQASAAQPHHRHLSGDDFGHVSAPPTSHSARSLAILRRQPKLFSDLPKSSKSVMGEWRDHLWQ